MWVQAGALAFALIFLIVGILRIVEFSGLELSGTRYAVLVTLHAVGCALFSAALAAIALDTRASHRTLAFTLFCAALAALAPGQFTIAVRRRRALGQNRKQAEHK